MTPTGTTRNVNIGKQTHGLTSSTSTSGAGTVTFDSTKARWYRFYYDGTAPSDSDWSSATVNKTRAHSSVQHVPSPAME